MLRPAGVKSCDGLAKTIDLDEDAERREPRSRLTLLMTRSPGSSRLAGPLAALLFLGAVECWPSEPVDPLWKSAVAIAAASQGWRPTRTVARTEDLAKDGRVKSVEEVTFAYPPGSNGEPRPELVRFLRDGVDVTERERAKLAAQQRVEAARKKKDEGRRVTFGVGGTPFDPQHQATVSLRRAPERRTIDGRACQAFEYSRADPAGGRFVGTAFLDEQTGAPLSLRERPDPLPRFADRLWVTLSFTYKGAGEWYPTRVYVEGSGGLLFIRKSVRTTIDLFDYRRTGAADPDTRQ